MNKEGAAVKRDRCMTFGCLITKLVPRKQVSKLSSTN